MTLQLPRVPASKGFTFGDTAAYRERQALAQEIRAIIEILIKSTYIPAYMDILRKFQAVIEPGAVLDYARLPYQGGALLRGRDSHGKTKVACVYAAVAWAVRSYWDNNADEVRATCECLRKIAAKGIDRCEIRGNVRDGFYLEV